MIPLAEWDLFAGMCDVYIFSGEICQSANAVHQVEPSSFCRAMDESMSDETESVSAEANDSTSSLEWPHETAMEAIGSQWKALGGGVVSEFFCCHQRCYTFDTLCQSTIHCMRPEFFFVRYPHCIEELPIADSIQLCSCCKKRHGLEWRELPPLRNSKTRSMAGT